MQVVNYFLSLPTLFKGKHCFFAATAKSFNHFEKSELTVEKYSSRCSDVTF